VYPPEPPEPVLLGDRVGAAVRVVDEPDEGFDDVDGL
jgi:hypothetical protein